MTEWNFNRKEAPKEELVLCWSKRAEFPKIAGLRLEGGASPGYSIDYGWKLGVTCWMVLPKPPQVSHWIEIRKTKENHDTM